MKGASDYVNIHVYVVKEYLKDDREKSKYNDLIFFKHYFVDKY